MADAPTYTPYRKTGRCRNGAEADGGVLYHAVPNGGWKALCGTSPGKRSDWSSWAGDAVTCPRCLDKIPNPRAEVK